MATLLWRAGDVLMIRSPLTATAEFKDGFIGISINTATQMARIAPMLSDGQNGIMPGRQKRHFKL